MEKDQLYISRCIELAKKALGNTYPNPLVGSVIVYNDQIIGEGFHQKAGQPHAEINAINSVKDKELLKNSTIYVSLEPCSHFGKTPPCALKLKEIGFKRVVIATLDSHDKVNGKGQKILEDAGIEVLTSVLEKEAIELNKRFFTYHQKKRPFIILKWAQSHDGFIDRDFKPTSISNSLAKQFVHQLRHNEHAILVGKNTALHDNPSLTTREIKGRNPIRILIDHQLEVPHHFNIYNNEAPTIVFNTLKEEINQNIQFVKISEKASIDEILNHLYQLQIQSILVEGGAYTLQQFIKEGLWDEAIILENPNLNIENGTKAPVLNISLNSITELRDNRIRFYQKR